MWFWSDVVSLRGYVTAPCGSTLSSFTITLLAGNWHSVGPCHDPETHHALHNNEKMFGMNIDIQIMKVSMVVKGWLETILSSVLPQ